VTPQEQIAYVRRLAGEWMTQSEEGDILAAVCDLAERALLSDDEREAVQACLEWGSINDAVEAVLQRLLGETP
jgi:hypothetical protein